MNSIYIVELASDTASALACIDEAVDVVILDRCLPDGNGDVVLSTIRDRGLSCRVAMVTAVDPSPEIVDLAFDEYLCKPVSKAELRAEQPTGLRRILRPLPVHPSSAWGALQIDRGICRASNYISR